jgi:stringent starvation protein B
MDKTPDKKARLLASLERGMTMVHLDARRPGVLVPDHLKKEPQLLLNLSYRFTPPDLTVSEWGLRETLTFSGSTFCVAVPWSALYAITSHATKEFFVYPDDMPPELLASQTQRLSAVEDLATEAHEEEATVAAQGQGSENANARAVLREVVMERPQEPDAPKEPPRRGHLRLVK